MFKRLAQDYSGKEKLTNRNKDWMKYWEIVFTLNEDLSTRKHHFKSMSSSMISISLHWGYWDHRKLTISVIPFQKKNILVLFQANSGNNLNNLLDVFVF